MDEAWKSLKEFKDWIDSLSKPRLMLAGSFILSGAYVEALGSDKGNVYMQIGGAALILTGACIKVNKAEEPED